MTADNSAPLAGMRGRLSAVPLPPRVVMPDPVPATDGDEPLTPAASGATAAQAEVPPLPTAAERGGGDVAPRARNDVQSQTGDRSSQDEPNGPASPAQASAMLSATGQAQELLAAASDRGFSRVVRDLYDDRKWDDGLNMTWALPRAVRDTVARFGVDAGLANKRAATAVMYLGLLQLGLEIRPNTADEDRISRRRT